MYIIYIHIYKKLRPNRKKLQEQKAFYFQFYILCVQCKFQENRTSSIIKIFTKFVNDPLTVLFFIHVSRSVNCKTCSVLVATELVQFVFLVGVWHLGTH